MERGIREQLTLSVSITGKQIFLFPTNSKRWRDKGKVEGERAGRHWFFRESIIMVIDSRREKWHEVADFVSRDERREIARKKKC